MKCFLFVLLAHPRFRRLCDHLSISGVERLDIDGPNASTNHKNDRTQPTMGKKITFDSPTAAEVHQQPMVKASCADFLDLDPADPQYANVQSILLDPSCSGSGLSSRQPDETTATDPVDSDCHAERLKRLASLQAKMLRHALRFPQVQRVVYSTCSVNEEVRLCCI